MKRLVVSVMLASAISSQAFGAVIDVFDCSLTMKNDLTGVESTQKSQVESRRVPVEVNGWPYGDTLYHVSLNFIGEQSTENGRVRGEYFPEYYVAVKRDHQGTIVAAKFFDSSWIGGGFCASGADCSVRRPPLPLPADPFGGYDDGWKEMTVYNGLPVLNPEDSRRRGYTVIDAAGQYKFSVEGLCRFKATIEDSKRQ